MSKYDETITTTNDALDPTSGHLPVETLLIGDLYQLSFVSEDVGYCVDLRVGALWTTRSSLDSEVDKNFIDGWLHPGDLIVPIEIVPWSSHPNTVGPMLDVLVLTSHGLSWILGLRKSIIPEAFERLSCE